jgi:hypothetical protein
LEELIKLIAELEKRVAALEGQVKAQPKVININFTIDNANSDFIDCLAKCIIHYQDQMSRRSC